MNKNAEIINVMCEWITLYQKGISLKEYLNEIHVSTVAIYGFGKIGRMIVQELRDSNITVKYVIDKNADKFKVDVPIITYEDIKEQVDLVIVTVVGADESEAICDVIRREKKMNALSFYECLIEIPWYLINS